MRWLVKVAYFSCYSGSLAKNLLVKCGRIVCQVSSVQSLSHVQLFATPWIAACQTSLYITNSRSLPGTHELLSHELPKPVSIESVMASSHLILCHPLLLLPPIPPSIRVFSNESTRCMRWPKYWSFSFNISSSNEHPGLISFRMDWLDLLVVRHSQNNYGKRRRHHVPKWTSENWYPHDRKRTDVSWKSLEITLTATIFDHLPQTKHPVKSSPCSVSLNLPGNRDV